MTPIPCEGGDLAFRFGVDASKATLDAITVAAHLPSDKVGWHVANEWDRMHRAHLHSRVPPVQPREAAEAKRDDGLRLPVCSKVRFCICQPAGQRMYRFRNAILKQMKSACRAGTKTRDLLMDGFVVMRLVTLVAGEGSEDGEQWWHIGFQLFVPYAPAFHLLARAPDTGDLIWNPNRVWLKA